MDAHSLVRVLDRLEQDGIDVWLDGGWGVDALLERETREHDDLDLVAELRNSDRIIGLLGELGYELVDGAPPVSFVLVDRRGGRSTSIPSRSMRRAAVSTSSARAVTGSTRPTALREPAALQAGPCGA